MTATRVRKKGCPFCKAGPDRCVMEVDRMVQVACIMCVECGARGPEVEFLGGVLPNPWLRWNQRG